jgi:hypothetical protein
VHEFLARLPASLQAKGGASVHQLIVTTNYDDALEQALIAEQEPFDLVWYATHSESFGGKFVHKPYGEEPCPIDCPNEYRLPVDERTVVLKIHGAVFRDDLDNDSYVISEDDYIKFLTHASLQELIPATLLAKLSKSHILFMGYSLQDWNLRVILHHMMSRRVLRRDSWAIKKDVHDVDRMLWEMRDVHLHEVALDAYVAELDKRMFGKQT